MIYRIRQFVPCRLESGQEFLALRRQVIVLAGRPLGGLHPLVREHVIVLQPGQQGIERTFYHYQLGFFQTGDDVWLYVMVHRVKVLVFL